MLETDIIYGISPNIITLNDLEGDDHTKHREFIKVSRVLMDTVRMRRGLESFEKKEGAEDFGSYRDVRIVQLFGTIAADNNKTLNENEALLRKMFNPRYAEYLSSDGKGYLPFKWTEEHPSSVSRLLQMDLKPYAVAKIDEDETEKLRRKFEIALVGRDPKKYSQTLTTEADKATGHIAINGDDFTYPIIEIAAADFTSVAKIENKDTGKYVELTGSITAGKTLVIDMGAGTILEDTTNKISMFTVGSEFFELSPGSNEITLTNITKITLKFYKGYN